jgi:hypothetical protein
MTDLEKETTTGKIRKRISKVLMDLDSLEAEYGVPDETTTNETGDITFRAQIRDVKTGTFALAPTKIQAAILYGQLSKVFRSGKTVAYVHAYGNDLPEVLRTIHYLRKVSNPGEITSETYEHVALKSNFEVSDAETSEIENEYSSYLHGMRIELGINM